MNELAKYSTVPVWNGLTNEFHPTQILADFLTIKEHFGKLAGLKFAYMGDARYNMGNSLMIGCAKMGLHFVACAPKAYWPAPELVEKCKAIAAETGATITLSDDTDAVKDANVVYTDVWVSMGEPVEVWAERIEALAPYQVNTELMAKAKPTAVFMHCLPAYHDHKTAVGKEMGEKFGRDAIGRIVVVHRPAVTADVVVAGTAHRQEARPLDLVDVDGDAQLAPGLLDVLGNRDVVTGVVGAVLDNRGSPRRSGNRRRPAAAWPPPCWRRGRC